MPTRTATAQWKGGLKGGAGSFKGQTGLGGSYSFGSRFQDPALKRRLGDSLRKAGLN